MAQWPNRWAGRCVTAAPRSTSRRSTPTATASLTNAELTARATARLGAWDGNGDGALDRAELIAAMPAPRDNLLMVFAPDPSEARADRLLAFMGATETGRIEIVAMSERQVNALLAWFDENRDGAISLAESEAAPRHGPGRMMGHGHGEGRGRPRG